VKLRAGHTRTSGCGPLKLHPDESEPNSEHLDAAPKLIVTIMVGGPVTEQHRQESANELDYPIVSHVSTTCSAMLELRRDVSSRS
jgi:hypothetical protein